jgi:hypothetical protein
MKSWPRHRVGIASAVKLLLKRSLSKSITPSRASPKHRYDGRRVGEVSDDLHLAAFLTLFCIVFERITSSLQRSRIKADALDTGTTENSAGQLLAGADVRPFVGPALPRLVSARRVAPRCRVR